MNGFLQLQNMYYCIKRLVGKSHVLAMFHLWYELTEKSFQKELVMLLLRFI
jgi:hypothetical protein